MIPRFTRRDFLFYGSATLAGVTLGQAGRLYLTRADAQAAARTSGGAERWSVSVCRECPAGCGIRVRLVNDVPVKVEGNPNCPIGRGRLCAKGQASLESYFDPDRLVGPVRRTGSENAPRFEPIAWDEAIRLVADKILAAGRAGEAMLAIGVEEHGPIASAWQTFWRATGAKVVSVPAPTAARLRPYLHALTGADADPTFDLEHATHVLSFGAPLVEDWISPVWSQRSYGRFRREDSHARGRLVQIDARRSLTARKADEWIAVPHELQASLAYGIASVLFREHRANEEFLAGIAGDRARFEAALAEQYTPDGVAAVTGVPVVTILRLARELAATARPLVIAAVDADPRLLDAMFALNALLGAFDRPGGIYGATDSTVNSTTAMAPWPPKDHAAVVALCDASALRTVEAASAVRDAQFVVSLSPYLDESALLADVVLPAHTPLEAWHALRPAACDTAEKLAVARPAVSPRLETRDLAEILHGLAKRVGSEVAGVCEWKNSEGLIARMLAVVFSFRRGTPYAGAYETEWVRQLESGGWWAAAAATPEEFTRLALDAGGWVDPFTESGGIRQALRAGPGLQFPVPPALEPTMRASKEKDGALRLVGFTPATLSLTGNPNQPVLYELLGQPDFEPWQVWGELNPETARELAIVPGARIRIVGEHGAVDVRARVAEGTPPATVVVPCVPAMPAGGRWARRLQADIRPLLAGRAPHEPVFVKIETT